MYLVLLGFGTILSVAGIVLAGAGLSLRDGSFNAGVFTPGIVAAVGGLLLIGLGLALRTLQQIERALAARPMPRVVQTPFTGATEAPDESSEASVFAYPPQAKQAAAPAAVAAGTSDDQPAHAVTQRAPKTRRLGNRSYPPLTKQISKRTRITSAGGVMARRQREFRRGCRSVHARAPRRNDRSRRRSIRCGRKTRGRNATRKPNRYKIRGFRPWSPSPNQPPPHRRPPMTSQCRFRC
jgi:hypothetical protein